jgi:hypothetical protein
MAKKPRQTKLLKCLKRCMYSMDREMHEKHQGSPGGEEYLESREHTNDLLDICVPRCKRKRKRKR